MFQLVLNMKQFILSCMFSFQCLLFKLESTNKHRPLRNCHRTVTRSSFRRGSFRPVDRRMCRQLRRVVAVPVRCAEGRCKNGATCTDDADNAFKCTCRQGYTGTYCEQDVVTGLCFTCRLPLLFTRARCCHRSVFYLPSPSTVYTSKMLSQVCVLLAVSLYCLHEQDVVTGLCFTCRLPLLFTRARCCHRSVFYLPSPSTVYTSKMLSQVCVLLAVSLYCLHEQDVVTGLCFTCRLPLLFTRARCCHRSVFYLPSPSTVYTSKMLSQVCVLLAVSLYCLHEQDVVTGLCFTCRLPLLFTRDLSCDVTRPLHFQQRNLTTCLHTM